MHATYRDVMKCPLGHKRTIIRLVGVARAARAAKRRIKSYCCACCKSYYVTPGKPPEPNPEPTRQTRHPKGNSEGQAPHRVGRGVFVHTEGGGNG